MKKILIISIGLFFVFQYLFAVDAKTNSNKDVGNKPVVTETEDEEAGEEALSPSEAAKAKTATAKLNRIKEETEDPDIESEVEELIEEEESIEKSAQEALSESDNRPAAVKFLIGPDYKNLGQLRKEVVNIRNNIRQLEKIQERAGESEQALIESALLELEETASGLQARMYTKLSEFSLFGWLFRWLNGFTPPDEDVAPTVTATPSITGVVTGSPILTPTETETETPSPTEMPTLTPLI